MLWLQPRPWRRWLLAGVIVVAAIWVEFRPAPVGDILIATSSIHPGQPIDAHNTEIRRAPVGLLSSASRGEVAIEPITAGDPVLASSTGDPEPRVPPGWWVVSVPLPSGAHRGMPAAIVLLDTGRVVDGIVASDANADPLGPATGGVAVSPQNAAEVAVASADGRAVVLIEAG